VGASATNHAAIAMQGVCLDISGSRILDGISWEVTRGEKWVVLGLNGSGKSSLLRLISGFGYPSRGTMHVLGEPFGKTDLRVLRRHVGWVHGDLAADFPRFMNGREVVMSGAEGAIALYEDKDGRAAEEADAALDSIGARHLAGRLFHTLSTGERQRVLIARALAAGPRILLLDEPCIGLDPVAREDFLLSLSVLFQSRPDLTVIGVTHHVEEIIDGFTRLLVLAKGRVAGQGERDEVMAGPAIARVYGERCRVDRHEGRYAMRFVAAADIQGGQNATEYRGGQNAAEYRGGQNATEHRGGQNAAEYRGRE
jgi:iron complex transport system ATP-binding protein